jgi:SAM-dependent methyltransferase
VSSIVDFGCWRGEEPFVLLWTLNAKEVMVVEINENHLVKLQEKIEMFSHLGLLEGCSVTFVQGDMTSIQLRSDCYDLAYCEEVLYDVFTESEQKLRMAIDKMISVVKPGGWVVAVENQVGIGTGEWNIAEPKNISSYFESYQLARLERVKLPGAPLWSYCYKKAE